MVPTVTTVVAFTLPVVAVTVIDVPVATPLPERVAVACPLESVVADVTVTVPAVLANATVAPDTTLLLASFATAVMVAVTLPSAEICDGLDETVKLVAPLVGGDVGLPPFNAVELPPHPASNAAPSQTIIDTLRMLFISSLGSSLYDAID